MLAGSAAVSLASGQKRKSYSSHVQEILGKVAR